MFFDIRRGGIETLQKALQIVVNHDITYVHAEGEEQKENETQRFRDRWFGPNSHFDVSYLDDNQMKKNLLLPLTQQEINTNDALTSADQNFGY